MTTTQRVFNGRFRPVWISAAVYLGVSAALRITLWASFGRPAGTSLPDLAAIVSLGVINDLVMLVGLLFPLTLGLALVPRRWLDGRIGRWASEGAGIGFLFGVLYLACVEYFFFQEFDSRFNLVAVDYLIYPHEVFINIWQTYPVLRALLGVGIASAVIFWGMHPRLIRRASPMAGGRERLLFAGSIRLQAFKRWSYF